MFTEIHSMVITEFSERCKNPKKGKKKKPAVCFFFGKSGPSSSVCDGRPDQ